MEWNKNLSLEEVIDMCSKHISGEITREEFQEWGAEKMLYRAFLPIEIKKQIIETILTEVESKEDFVEISQIIEMNKFWYILLEYTNIQNFNKKLMTLDNYNILFPNLYPAIISVAVLDYEVIQEMLQTSLRFVNINNILSLTEVLRNFDFNKNAELTEDVINLLKNPEKIQDLKEMLFAMISQEDNSIIKKIKKTALQTSKIEINNEKE